MPDLPPPYTIGEANITGTGVSSVVKYVGFMSPETIFTNNELEKTKKLVETDNRPLVFIQISGPDVTKKKFVAVTLQSCTELSKICKVIISLGYPKGSSEPRKLTNGALVYDWCPIKDELMALASVLVSRSGHRTIGQCIQSGKPAVLIPIYNHSEQMANAEKFQGLGLGLEIKSENLDAKKLVEAVARCLNDDKFKANAEKLRRISQRYPGLLRSAEIIKSYL